MWKELTSSTAVPTFWDSVRNCLTRSISGQRVKVKSSEFNPGATKPDIVAPVVRVEEAVVDAGGTAAGPL